MNINELAIYSFRNVDELVLDCNAGFNLILGPNGSGKTSILEAIYYLSYGKSFRKTQNAKVIQHGHSSLCVRAILSGEKHLGIQRHSNGSMDLKINGELAKSKADVASLLPIQLINPDSYRFFDDGPDWRRKLIDWGLFHVEHQYLSVWRKFQRLLKQRNAALRKQGVKYDDLQAWDVPYVELSNAITSLRQGYVELLQNKVIELSKAFNFFADLSFSYDRGWRGKLSEALYSSFVRDSILGYTQKGPQRADMKILVNGHPAAHHLSRGQQKSLVTIIKLAQAYIYKESLNKSCVFLIDDLPSELDKSNQDKLLSALSDLGGQVFITAIDRNDLFSHDCFKGLAPVVLNVSSVLV